MKKFYVNERMKKLVDRSNNLSLSGKRTLYAPNPEFLIYHWSGECEAFAPITGEMAPPKEQLISFGDHSCRIDNGKPFPFADQMPSKVEGFEMTQMNWAKDYAFFLDHSPAEIYENEIIVGEFHWQLDEARLYKYPQECQELGFAARQLGAGGFSHGHTCPDLSIGLELGWTGILQKIRENKAKFKRFENKKSVEYLEASEVVVEAIIRHIEKYSRRAWELYEKETDSEQKELYRRVAENCHVLTQGPPLTFEQGLQWVYLFITVERMCCHGNGYGRIDQFMYDLYRKDMDNGSLTRDEARNLLAELYLKYGTYYSVGGRNEKLEDATNELSWVAVEAYDMVGGYSHLGVMWHSDIDKDFYRYACEVVARHGSGTPTLVSYDTMRESELFSGVSEEDAWNVSYSGCQWYCVVGKEHQDQDINCIVLVQPMQRAMKNCIDKNIEDFEGFWKEYEKEVNATVDALVALKNAQYAWQPLVWPEMVISTCMHGPIEKGRDVTDTHVVNNNYESVNLLGTPNVIDSMYAMKKLVFEQKRYTMEELQDALDHNWEGKEEMRQRFLHADKFGNDLDEVDEMAVRVTEQIRENLERKHNIKGFHFRPSLNQYMGHVYAGQIVGATPDGRKAEEFLAHAINPMHGRNTNGLSATSNSITKINLTHFQGAAFQIELEPAATKTIGELSKYVDDFSTSYFKRSGIQINLNIVDLKELEKAMDDPHNPKYRDICVKVTGYSAHFVTMGRKLQEEFVARVNYMG